MLSEVWYENENVLTRARDGQLDFIYGQVAKEKGQYDELEFKEIREIFDAEHPKKSFSTVGDYVASFKHWYTHQGYIYHSLTKGATISVTRSYALPDGGTINLSIGGQFSVRNSGTLGRINDGLMNMLESEYSRLLAKMFKDWQPPKMTDQKQITPRGATQLSTDEKTVSITHLDVLYQDGRKMVRAFGGEFTKHGIPIYQEVLRGMDLDESKMEIAKQVQVNRTAIVKMRPDGKNPIKVIGWWD